MTCNRCVSHVESALRALPGVSQVEVDLTGSQARITHDPAAAPPATLVAAVEDAGYAAAAD
ncbi:MAG: heavy-metal-associated domain-containing protein [Myxococcota bacterium]|nr:heavy-metal-associated domain-containing protein [Myxococcota bacterium]